MQHEDTNKVVKYVTKLVGLTRLYHYMRKTDKVKVTDTVGQIKNVVEFRQIIWKAWKETVLHN
jgi:flagellin-specific chaperone FliS